MSDMRIVINGAAGRMGRTLVALVHNTKGAVVSGALERPGVPIIGQDAGELAGVGNFIQKPEPGIMPGSFIFCRGVTKTHHQLEVHRFIRP